MKNFKKCILVLILFVSISNICSAIPPTYKLTAQNFTLKASNELVFDINLLHTNSLDTVFQYSLGQYSFNFDTMFCAGGTIIYDIAPGNTGDSSDFPFYARPRNPSRVGNILRINSNSVLGIGNGPIVSNIFEGSKVIRMRLRTSATSFSSTNLANLHLMWRNANAGSPFVKIFGYIGGLNTEITDSTNHFIIPTTVVLVSPSNNSINNPLTINFIWRKMNATSSYVFQVFTDSLLNNIIINDTINNYLDTSKSISGFAKGSKYYWNVGYKDTNGVYNFSTIFNFSISSGLSLNLKVIPEGIYYPLFNILSRKDTINIYIRNTLSPFTIIDSANTTIDSLSFSNVLSFTNAQSGTYYIVVKHLNSIETWSKSGGVPMTLTDTAFYDFTTSISQSYGNNLKLKGSKYCIISGDVDRDGYIDASDASPIDNDSYISRTGRFLPTDLNGDNFVDADDMNIQDNNRNRGVIQP